MNTAVDSIEASVKIRPMSEHQLSQQQGWIPNASDHLHFWSPDSTTDCSLRTNPEEEDPIALMAANGLAHEITGNIRSLQHFSLEGHFALSYCRDSGLRISRVLTCYVKGDALSSTLKAKLATAIEAIVEKANCLAQMPAVCTFDMRRVYTLQKTWPRIGKHHLGHH